MPRWVIENGSVVRRSGDPPTMETFDDLFRPLGPGTAHRGADPPGAAQPSTPPTAAKTTAGTPAPAAAAAPEKKPSALPATARRRSRLLPNIGLWLVPIVLLLVGAGLLTSALGWRGGGGDSSGDNPSTRGDELTLEGESAGRESTNPDPSVAVTAPTSVIPLPPVGDPLLKATAIAQTYLTALSSGDLTTARLMTPDDIDEDALDNLDSATAIIVRSAQTGPDRMSLRLVLSEYRTTDRGPTTTFRCAQWELDVAAGRLTQRGIGDLREPMDGSIIPGDLATTLGAECDAATFG